MKKLLSLGVTLAGLFMLGCQPTDVQPLSDQDISPNASSGRMSSLSTVCDNISFNNVAAGTFLTQLYSDRSAGPVLVNGYNPNKPGSNSARVFNSANPHLEDVDLGTPNKAFGGPGEGAGGASGAYVNNIALGNLLLIQNYEFSEPNDDDVDGAKITFDFSALGAVTASSIKVIDVEAEETESGAVKLYDGANNLLGTTNFPATGANGVATVSLGGVTGVVKMVVEINGSIAIDDIDFCRTQSNHCTYTQGYWKNHPEAWPVSSLTLGTKTYTKSQLLAILSQPVKGNGLVALAHQLIAAKLNLANGSNPSALNGAIAAADAKINGLLIPPVGNGIVKPSETSSLVNTLSQYNEGIIGPGHCD